MALKFYVSFGNAFFWAFCLAFSFWLISLASAAESPDSQFIIGVGSYDSTGPVADVNLMGYADPGQNAAGLHFRLRSRAFIVAEQAAANSSEGKRFVFVNLDACMASQGITLKVLSRLKKRYGGLYDEKNVAISGIHTHSGPGGYLQYVLYIITSLGFVRQSFDALVDGIEKSIIQAHENLRPGSVYMNQGELLDANINRSPSAYLNNPPEERQRFKYNVDKDMVLLKFVDAELGAVGSLNWFAVHGTSMNRSNVLVSGDNKGAASRFMEDWFERQATSTTSRLIQESEGPVKADAVAGSLRRNFEIIPTIFSVQDDRTTEVVSRLRSTGGKPATRFSSIDHRVRSKIRLPSRPPFVAAFAQTNEGDVSPNILGTFCVDTGLPCEFNHSTCNGHNELCIGRGPGYPDHFASTKTIAERQYQKAVELFESASKVMSGKVDYRQKYIDFSRVTMTLPPKVAGSPQTVTTCPAAVGFSFAAGTTDGPGAFNFVQGDNHGNLFWRLVGSALKAPTKQQVACQKPKPILIDTGEMFMPYPWAPSILPIQILRIGQFIILAVPSEFTTMAGRRLREAVKETLIAKGNGEFSENTTVVIAGLTNGYSQYVTTYEEYQIQRYEGASTLYGPHTLSAYIQEFKKLADALADGSRVEAGPSPPYLVDQQIELLPGVVADGTPIGVNFGDLKKDVPENATYKIGDVVEAVFWSGCPRNDLFTEGTYSLVEFLNINEVWTPAYDDDDWSLRFLWTRPFSLSLYSFATIRWEIPETAAPGIYRLRHFGAYKHFFGSIKHFTGASSAFVVS
ncbi:hypothetical protein O6H91_01G069400 [Diphasiastrum complanatum]|uniref:Uncharacterized protein n=2 Tax=Diphasiastrum complanatum TaxID=34168 RepID=A0ACC2ES40_DIPCM|nr:hypothetical protein O6H91_01G069400 [Diphasiastrum complanatum]KAJ7569272.1 hypothetical protein O6H91_01G069400 [Diphasiastrum complanatum]